MSRLWILGASDPEMVAIERVLTVAGEVVAYAVGHDGQRVHPGNAYRAIGYRRVDGGSSALSTSWAGPVILVECGGNIRPTPRIRTEDESSWSDPTILSPCEQPTIVDHHRPGDPGYDRSPAEFFVASSIGQVLTLLDVGIQYAHGEQDACRILGRNEGSHGWEYVFCGVPGYRRHVAGKNGIWDGDPAPPSWTDELDPTEVVLAAAADHCLASAYRGECPGFDPDTLMRWRIASRAAFQGRSEAEILADIEAARTRLLEAVGHPGATDCGHGDYLEAGCAGCGLWGPPPGAIADLRGERIPELPEASAREGIPFLSSARDRDGREKIVLQSAPPGLISRFLAGTIVPGLVDSYGDPARGFAGGYVA